MSSPAADHAPLVQRGESSSYGALAVVRRRRRPIKKAQPSPVKIEAKVWFANERTWIAWLRASLLVGSFALAMLNSASFFAHAPDDSYPSEPGVEPSPPPYNPVDSTFIRAFGSVYVLISVSALLWGLASYHRRVSLIKRKYPGPLDDLVGPPLICAALFLAILVNFVCKVKEYRACGV